MKNPLVVAFIALALGAGAVASLLVQALFPAPEPSDPVGAVSPAPDGELLTRVDELSAENRALRERIASLELRSAPAVRAPVAQAFVSVEEFQAFREEVRAALSRGGVVPGVGVPGDVPEPEFTELVSQAMDEIQVQEARDQAQRRVESRAERLRERLAGVREKLYLSPEQERALESALVAHYERQEGYAVLWATGEVQEKMDFGPIIANDNQILADELAGFLTPQQLEDYQGLNDKLFPDYEVEWFAGGK